MTCRYVIGTVPGVPLRDACAALVYTGKGALIRMPGLTTWAADLARSLRPGGHLFVYEGHPAVPLWTWDEDEPGRSRRAENGRMISFCKTGRHPYDVAVATILLRCHRLLPEQFSKHG